VCAQGKWLRAGPWDATIAGYEIPLAFVLPPAGEEAEYAGRIEGRIRANGAPGRVWVGDAGMRIIDAAIVYRPPGAPPQTLNLGTGGLAATATPERIDFSFGIQAFSDTFLYANAQLARDGRNDILNLPLTGDMRARAADANILPLVFREIDHAAGLLTANAAFTGTLTAPKVTGRIELANGEFDSYRVNLALRELSFVGDVSSDRLDFRGSGRAGEGSLSVDGRFAWGGEAMQGDMHLKGDNLLVADLPEYRVVASPDLRFQVEGRRIDVVGDVVIPSALLQPNELKGAVRVSDDARYVGEHRAEREGLYTVNSEVRIAMGEDVRINSFGLEGRITGSVGTTIRTGETPIGRGALDVQLGRYDAYGQQLDITRGRLLFDVSPLDDPGLDIEAKRIIDTTTVGLNVRGTLQEPRLTFFSDPSMPQTQIVSYLLTGKSSDALQGPETASVRSMQDSVAMQGGGLLASQIGRRVGLDAVGVESSVNSAGESDSSLVLGKFLSPRLFISYGISLTESINTLKLRYSLSERWLFRSESGENQSADIEFTVER
jgi:translocation and assembly module TamB